MPNNWKKCKLSEITTKIGSGATPRGGKGAYKESGISLIRSQNVLNFKFSVRGLAFIDEDQADKLKNVIIEENDVLLNITGDSVARVCSVPNEYLPARVNQHVAIIRANNNQLDSDFLKFALLEKSNKDLLLALASAGATRNAITKSMIEDFELKLPPLPEQKAIANILSAIDDKIENNLATNKTLEEMAMAFYKHWFVDFGPFQDGEFIESELGRIPKGWEVKRLNDLAHILNSKRVPLSTGQRSTRKGEYPYYGASGIIDNIDDFIFDGEYVIISEDGENLRSRKTPIGFSAVGKFWVNNHAHILEGIQNGINKLIICHIAQMDMNPYLTGAVQPKLNKNNLLSIGIAMPKEDSIIQEVLSEFYSISRLIFSNEDKNQTLTKLRDTLLPKLISGEVRLKEFREQVENVITNTVK
ncbi:restriction endonuclease subunit S [Tenacibaculum sp. Bg11-29]|uniref:restriction endonuclease subunit S n=1 Tax=Tenacibaculum sp. Bg11-29 TaxID=2058306 RepID=UPI000C331F07|nr:restriction endonuclease subunit S [Tenacibaculum sp. Bg11-29]PKH52147.1 restriction endonuclease subunit S [Tenacibaculum sp. Bg11-29]